MYPRNAASPPRIAIGAVVQISDGAVQTTGVSIVVQAEGGSETAGGGTLSYGASSGVVYYVPTQAETNYTAFVVTAYKTGCIPVSQTVITTASAISGKVFLSGETHTGATIPTVTDVTNLHASAATAANQTTILNRLGAWTGTGINTVLGAFRALCAKAASLTPTDISTSTTFDNTTDSAEALRDRGDAAWITATGFALATVCTEGRLAELDAANLPTDIAGVQSDTDNIQARLPAALSAGGNMKSDVLEVNASTNAAANLARGTLGVVLGTATTGGTTTSIPTSSLDPAASVTDQFKGRIVTFDRATTTVALRGQSTDITASTAGGTLTVTALTTAPASGDTFTIT